MLVNVVEGALKLGLSKAIECGFNELVGKNRQEKAIKRNIILANMLQERDAKIKKLKKLMKEREELLKKEQNK